MAVHARTIRSLFAALLLAATSTVCIGQNEKQPTLYDYKWQVDASWWFSSPSGFFSSANDTGYFDIASDLHFGNYSTFTGYADWRFKPKHHLLLRINPIANEQTTTITRDIEFQGVTYTVGTQISGSINSFSFTPGYQYDFLKRKQGYLGGRVDLTLINTKASLSGLTLVNGTLTSRSASGSVFNVMPIFGLQGRWYPMHNSNRVALDGAVEGMYFFGYGNFVSSRGFVALAFHSHWNATAGYQLGNRLSVHTKNSSEFGLELTQKGPIAGIEATW